MQSKKLLALLLASVMAFSLFACNTPAEDVTSEADSQTSEDVSEETSDNGVIEGFGNNLVDGTNIIDDHFDDNTKGEWGVYSNGGTFDLYAENGEMVVDIKHAGGMEYAVQIFRDGYCLNMGCVYTVSFDIYSDIERDIEWRFQINGGDFHPYYLETERRIGPDKQTITAEFTMEEASDPAPRLCFNLGEQGDLDTTVAHKVYIDNFVLTIKDASNAMALEPLPTPIPVKVNQVGYKPADEKILICKYDPEITDYTIVDTNNNVVYSGKLTTDFANSKSGDGAQVKGDFSDFTTPGTYKVIVDGVGESYEFTIADDIYDDLYKDVVRMLYLQRCGCALDESLAGDFAHAECHMQETTVYETGEVIDVTGGWHDAGDYGRYVSPGAKTVMDLFITYQDSEAARGDDYDIPESGNGVPDLLDEARYELEWMLKMQASNGGVYHKVTCANFPETVEATAETAPLLVSPVSPTATGDFAAVMARASSIYAEYDAEFAATCKDAAVKAYKYLIDNEETLTGFVNPEEIVTGEYPDGKFYDEIFWAAMELYLATGDTAYFDKAKAMYEENNIKGLGWADIGYYGMYSYLTADESLQTDAELAQKFIDKIVAECDENIKTAEKDAYYICLERSYPWGSNMTVANHGILYHMAAKFTGDAKYASYAQHQLDYLLGANPLGYCYVTGYGSWSPEHTHHRPSQVLGQTMPGMLVGGPNTNADDPYAKAVLSSSTGGMCYVDNDSCYSTNEITIYWNSPLIYLLSQAK
ncbi:MAG: glycoside hydrolase family 9 protein [Lachnospiraceae bacterium]|nr:glycoside hydrolase family 9 protein [Lachnospiraceae bacterium]